MHNKAYILFFYYYLSTKSRGGKKRPKLAGCGDRLPGHKSCLPNYRLLLCPAGKNPAPDTASLGIMGVKPSPGTSQHLSY